MTEYLTSCVQAQPVCLADLLFLHHGCNECYCNYIGTYVPLWDSIAYPLHMLRYEIPRLNAIIFNLLKISMWLPIMTLLISFLFTVEKDSFSPPLQKHLFFRCHNHFKKSVVTPLCSFNLHFPNGLKSWYVYHVPFRHLFVFFWETSIQDLWSL